MAVFIEFGDAMRAYDDAAYVVRNAPGEGATDDPTIVLAAALFWANAISEDAAKQEVAEGAAYLMEQEEWQGWDTAALQS